MRRRRRRLNDKHMTWKTFLPIFLLACNSVAQVPDYEWAHSFGGSSFEHGRDIAVDAAGNVYTVGSFRGTVDFDPSATTFNLTATGNSDLFIQKLDVNGNFQWAAAVGGTGLEDDATVAVDAAGNVYFSGHFSGTADFDPGPGSLLFTSSGINDIFVQKLSPAGNLIWAHQTGGISSDKARDIHVDAFGNVYVAGFFWATADFDPSVVVVNATSVGGGDAFIQKLDANGNLIWVRTMGGPSGEEVIALDTDPAGNVYAFGTFQGTADLDPTLGVQNFSAAGITELFVQKLDGNGNFLWARAFGGSSGFDYARGLAVDLAGNVYTTGGFEGTGDFDPTAGTFNLSSTGSTDIFLQKLGTNGNFLWANAMGSVGIENIVDVGVDGAGNVYQAGTFALTVDFDPSAATASLTASGPFDLFLRKLDGNGNFDYALQIGGTNRELGHALHVQASGTLHLTGAFRSTVDFDPGGNVANRSSNGDYDAFVLKLSQGGGLAIASPELRAAQWGADAVRLDWRGAAEAEYVVQRSGNGEVWHTIQPVMVQEDAVWEAIDAEPLAGQNFYRLRWENENGAGGISKVVSVLMETNATKATNALKCWPNPARNLLNVVANATKGEIHCFDMQGRDLKGQIRVTRTAAGRCQIDLSRLLDGVYLLEMGGKRQKFIKH